MYMDKYIGNKKVIVDGIKEFLEQKGILDGLIIDVFAGTTNVSQYFKQRGFDVISNDINEFSYVLGKAYLENNEFPSFEKLINESEFSSFVVSKEDLNKDKLYIQRKIEADKIFEEGYYQKINFDQSIEPLLKVLQYLNRISLENLSEEEALFFDYYTVWGSKSTYKSARGTIGKRNYFSEENAKKLGKSLCLIKKWASSDLITDLEKYILLACIIEEVTLNANVNGTFHDFNRSKLYPNAEAKLYFKPIMLNIFDEEKKYIVFREDANELYKKNEFQNIDISESVLYIDPPYNFRQYSAYYHMLNFIAKYCDIDDLLEYAAEFKFVRGQNMDDNFNSRYCYKDKFVSALTELIDDTKSRHVLISYYDENNHWSHGKKEASFEGRDAIINILKNVEEFSYYDKAPSTIKRKNYQSQSGGHKKMIDELLFYARR